MTEFISVQRARRILAPATGDDLSRNKNHRGMAISRLFDRIKVGKVTARATRPSPPHNNPRFAGVTEVTPIFLADPELLRGLVVNDKHDQPRLWEEWLFEGGLEVDLQDVIAIDGPDYRPNDADIADVASLDRWSLPMVTAWIATRNIAAVTQVLAPLTNFGSRRGQEASPVNVYQDDWGSRSRALGWLHKTVADGHCTCGALGDEDMERWQRCRCTKAAVRQLKELIRSGSMVAIVQRDGRTAQALFREEVDYLAFDDRAFELGIPDGIELIEFDRDMVLKFWPAGDRAGAEGLRVRSSTHVVFPPPGTRPETKTVPLSKLKLWCEKYVANLKQGEKIPDINRDILPSARTHFAPMRVNRSQFRKIMSALKAEKISMCS
jgi:hypothetical protein